jgi:hypothetical protein
MRERISALASVLCETHAGEGGTAQLVGKHANVSPTAGLISVGDSDHMPQNLPVALRITQGGGRILSYSWIWSHA